MTFCSDLPTLPLPELEESITEIKELIRPLVDDACWQKSCIAADALATQAEKLQKELSDYRNTLPQGSSWIRPFWDESYLSSRASLPLNSNYFIELKTDITTNVDDAHVKLASFLLALCRQFQRIALQAMPVEMVRGNCLSMDQLNSMLYSRVAALNSDMLVPVSIQGQISISVVCQGYWYLLTVSDISGQLVTSHDLADVLRHIRTDAKSRPHYSSAPIGAVCVATRNEAALLRQELCADLQNRLSLRAIEQSIFTLCLDDHDESQSFAQTLLGGSTQNRWYDKSLQVIADELGHIGLNVEHAGCDAGIWLYLLQCVDEENQSAISQNEAKSVQAQFHQLQWHIHSSLSDQLKHWHQKKQAEHAAIDSCFYENTDISREQLKTLGCSPDAFLQCCYQAAYYQLKGELASAYEAVSVRHFYQGRTECARPLTGEMALFIQQSAHQSIQKNLLKTSFLSMEQAHKTLIKRCQQGRGSERHMAGLYSMFALNNTFLSALPDLFADVGWQKLTHNTLSTSSIAAPFIRFFGFGPVECDGLGIGYSLNPSGLQLVVTSAKDSGIDANDFVHAFEFQADNIKKIILNDFCS